ncbi:MAG: serine hydrolase, partial [Armatimonadetes bacterium]|nr:serine hydrolase [Armatimonadota bacterium]
VKKVTGRTVLDYLTPRLFNPLGIEGQTWETCPKGINTGGWGLKVKTEDIARFGQLYLQKGQWQGKQLVPANWVAQATSKVVTNGDPATGSDWSQGYGYQFWQCLHGAYRGDGAFGQYCIVMPELDAVLAITSGVGDMQAVLTQVWEHLLPAMHSSTLPLSEAEGTLKRQLASLSVRPPEGKVSSPTAKRVSGKTYRFEANDQKIQSLTLRADGKHSTLIVHDEGGEHSFLCGSGSWVKSTTSLHAEPAQKSALWGAWTDENTFTIHNCLYETPFLLTIVCTFAGEQVTFSSGMNVGFGKAKQVPLVGRSG